MKVNKICPLIKSSDNRDEKPWIIRTAYEYICFHQNVYSNPKQQDSNLNEKISKNYIL